MYIYYPSCNFAVKQRKTAKKVKEYFAEYGREDDILEFDPAVSKSMEAHKWWEVLESTNPMNAEIILHYQQVNASQIY